MKSNNVETTAYNEIKDIVVTGNMNQVMFDTLVDFLQDNNLGCYEAIRTKYYCCGESRPPYKKEVFDDLILGIEGKFRVSYRLLVRGDTFFLYHSRVCVEDFPVLALYSAIRESWSKNNIPIGRYYGVNTVDGVAHLCFSGHRVIFPLAEVLELLIMGKRVDLRAMGGKQCITDR